MIVSFQTKETAEFDAGRRIKSFEGIRRQAESRLDRLHVAKSLADLAALAGNRLESLKGDRAGQYSVRINDQWRICFRWDDVQRGFSEVEIVDYH